MDGRVDALVLGIGNVLWADEGFGVRAVEALHAGWQFPANVRLMDGGTLGLNLFEDVASARHVLVFDAIDYGLPGGTLKVLRDAEVPAWGAKKISPHQTGFNDILGLALLRGSAPEKITAIGVQPVELSDFGGSLRPPVRARLAEAVELAVRELAGWGFVATPRAPGDAVEPLNAQSLALDVYESGRPTPEAACRIGDPRLLEGMKREPDGHD
jgi:hydrogenase maturation protease